MCGAKLEDCGGVDCPLGVPHPPASHNAMKAMYPLGCSLCRIKPDKNFLGVESAAITEVKLYKLAKVSWYEQ